MAMTFAIDIDTLIDAITQKREGLRHFAIRRLVNMGADAIPALIQALKDPRDLVRSGAAIALASIGSPALPGLREAMQSDDREISWGAAWVLATLKAEVQKSSPKLSAVDERALLMARTGVWSDAWLSRVSQQLDSYRTLDKVSLAELIAT